MKIRKISLEENTSTFPRGLVWFFMGFPKTGKTTQASRWAEGGSDKVLLIDTDHGTDFVDGANVVVCTSLNIPTRDKVVDGKKVTTVVDGVEKIVKTIIPPNERGFYHRVGADKGTQMEVYSMAEIYKEVKALLLKGQFPYEAIAIDTLDKINEWIEEIVAKELGQEAMGQSAGWGADWGLARRRNLDIARKWCDLCRQYGLTLIFTSHAKQRQVIDKKVQLGPELPGGLGRALSGKADIIGLSSIGQNKKPVITFRNFDEITIGSRLPALFQQSMDFDFKTVHDAIINWKPNQTVTEETTNGD